MQIFFKTILVIIFLVIIPICSEIYSYQIEFFNPYKNNNKILSITLLISIISLIIGGLIITKY